VAKKQHTSQEGKDTAREGGLWLIGEVVSRYGRKIQTKNGETINVVSYTVLGAFGSFEYDEYDPPAVLAIGSTFDARSRPLRFSRRQANHGVDLGRVGQLIGWAS